MTSKETPSFGQGDTSYRAAGEHAGLTKLVDSFYNRMGSDKRFLSIYNMHPDDQPTTRDKLSRFLCGWLGGPKLYNETYGSVAIPTAHAHVAITEVERNQWLTCMYESIQEQPYSEEFKTYLIEQLTVPAEAVRKRCDPQAQAKPWTAPSSEALTESKPKPCIWVDADACPVVVRDILFRAAIRTGIKLVLVANQALPSHSAPNIQTVQVHKGFDVADDEIVKRMNAGDLVVTSDIPLAAEVLEKNGHAITPRGERHTKENIGARLNMRDFLDTMRASGVDTRGGPSAFGQKEKQAFANSLDQFLAKIR